MAQIVCSFGTLMTGTGPGESAAQSPGLCYEERPLHFYREN